MIVYLRTDKPEAELWVRDAIESQQKPVLHSWMAHRELSGTLHRKLVRILNEKGKTISDISGIVFFVGPGSFTGLRIGASVAQALAWNLGVPLIGVNGDDWLRRGSEALIQKGYRAPTLQLHYGGSVNITTQKK